MEDNLQRFQEALFKSKAVMLQLSGCPPQDSRTPIYDIPQWGHWLERFQSKAFSRTMGCSLLAISQLLGLVISVKLNPSLSSKYPGHRTIGQLPHTSGSQPMELNKPQNPQQPIRAIMKPTIVSLHLPIFLFPWYTAFYAVFFPPGCHNPCCFF